MFNRKGCSVKFKLIFPTLLLFHTVGFNMPNGVNEIESKIDEVLVLERDEERAQTTADILSQLNDATESTSSASKKQGEVVGKQDEIMKFLQDMSPKIDKILKLESLEALLEQSTGKTDEALSKVQNISVDPPDLSPIMEKIEAMEPKIEKILKFILQERFSQKMK